MASMRENLISDYVLQKVDFQGDWSVKDIKREIKKMIGEEPGVKINYEKDVMINEVSGEAKEFKKITSINVIFTDDNNQFKSIEFLV